ncbi:hypothetical protein GIV23_18515 [Pseudomonas sp. PA-1-2A]|uniref:hypothetical protein n=1 Tax=Pseudomonas TaxID=286 RepID=UPI001EEF7CEB|nr:MULTISPECIES: hypothetical protein [Pseudomonas]MCF5691140.1 hypothetical protein [Pseudomonas sp. PA-1-8C]MCF5788726.1 hypothetical protein [Pseudomonas sp. PA-1-6G]MCF5791540.1 hypothetical protein [Pseudomonas sp. PA-1-6B]MCF5797651.1 hypothetical protein [Pseudomonas sp. PA-1-5A]MCF5815302.1 hypothetical protein [Pseudomonas sp. PA-1-2A]
MLNFEGWHRKLLTKQKALSADSRGKEILVGLTREDSELYIELVASDDPNDSDKFIELDKKHMAARNGFDFDEDIL